MNPSRLLLIATATCVIPLGAQTPPTPTPTATPAASVVAKLPADAPADFPYSLQGFFGKAGSDEISLREKSTGISAWIKPGKKIGGWKLERADAASGIAILTDGTRRITLRRAKEQPPVAVPVIAPESSPEAELKSEEDSVVFKKLKAFEKNPKIKEVMNQITNDAMEEIKRTRPDLLNKDGNLDESNPSAQNQMMDAMRRNLAKNTSEESRQFAPVGNSLLDAMRTVGSAPVYDRNAGTEAMAEFQKKSEAYGLKIAREADRIYLERYGKDSPETLPAR